MVEAFLILMKKFQPLHKRLIKAETFSVFFKILDTVLKNYSFILVLISCFSGFVNTKTFS